MATNDTVTKRASGSQLRYVVVALLVVLAFFASYRVAQGRSVARATNLSAATLATGGAAADPALAASGSGAGGGAGCACCGGGGAAAPESSKQPKDAVVAGDVQKIDVDVSKGYYDPSVIVLKAGTPAEITFSQSSGCTAVVQSQQLGFQADLSSGPKTVKIGALQPGEYEFSCGMQMVFGKIVVK